MTYTQRMIELNPVLGSILGRCETHIQDMIGSEVRVILEEPINNDDSAMPLWGWMNTEHKNRIYYEANRADLTRLLQLVATLWKVPKCYVQIPKNKRDIVAMKQIFAMLVRQYYPTVSLLEIGKFLNRPDHSTAFTWIKNGRKFLYMKDPYFMSFYSPVKYLFDADNI